MANAKQELLNEIADISADIKCAYIMHGREYSESNQGKYFLKDGHLEEELRAFLDSLDFEYDNGYGGQRLFGNVWFADGTWLERGEYDGSEWWEHKVCPEIPDELKQR